MTIIIVCVENIMVAHHYTNDLPSTAAVAANAGTCLEDGDSHDNNVFDNLDEAISNVCYIQAKL